MPKVQFEGRTATLADYRRANEMMASKSRYEEDVQRQLNQLESFMRANPRLQAATHRKSYVWTLFSAQWELSARAVNTAIAMVNNFVTFRVNPWDLDEARDRVSEYGVLNGLRRYARLRLAQDRRFVRNISAKPLPWISEQRPSDHGESEYQCFWALVCVTGNRPHDVYLAEIVDVTNVYVEVKWVSRKVKAGVTERYEFGWTRAPPAWVRCRWRLLGTHQWRFRQARTMAACLNTWLKKKGIKIDLKFTPRESGPEATS